MPDPPLILHNLLDEPLLGVEDDQGRREQVTLPALLARLSHERPTTLTAVQAHQQHAVHAFLVQLAAIALTRASSTDVAHDEAAWRALLLQTAKADGGGPEAFALIVGDLSRPAFLQPPVPEGTLNALKNEHTLPSSDLDVLITAKNHDVKIDRLADPTVEHWIFSLLTLQTMQGFLGAGNYGIARMNGGFASRPCVAFAPAHGAAPRFLRDVRALLNARVSLINSLGFTEKRSIGLVWCAPWDGSTSLAFRDLDPFFIEICRRIRLGRTHAGAVVAHRGTSKVARIDARDATGNTGDAWTPVDRDGKALTMPEAGFTYDRVHELLFGNDYQPGAAGKASSSAAEPLWVGQVLVRGQGKTGGYHERWVLVPSKAQKRLSRPDDRAKLGDRSKGWIDRAEIARRKILRPALLNLLQGAPEQLKLDDDRANAFLRRLDAAIDEVFFPLLFQHVDDPPEIADEAFEKKLIELAESQLNFALGSLPVPSARRWRAEDKARRVFYGAAHKHFKLAFPEATSPSAQAAPAHGDTA